MHCSIDRRFRICYHFICYEEQQLCMLVCLHHHYEVCRVCCDTVLWQALHALLFFLLSCTSPTWLCARGPGGGGGSSSHRDWQRRPPAVAEPGVGARYRAWSKWEWDPGSDTRCHASLQTRTRSLTVSCHCHVLTTDVITACFFDDFHLLFHSLEPTDLRD